MTGNSKHAGDPHDNPNLDLFIDGSSALSSAAVFSVIAVVVSFYEMYMHLKYYNRPLLQRQVIRIILMVPIYALGSLASLSLPDYGLYFNTVRDVYEAYVIHSFLSLMLDFPGGEPAVIAGIADLPHMKHPMPFCCLPRMRLNHSFIQNCKRSTLQFVFIKPTMAFISLILMMFSLYDTPEFQYFLVVIYNLSYTSALYGLVLFYMATKKLLKGFSPVGKFAAVKIIVFATYYQSLLVVAIPGMDVLGSSEKWNDYILCIEMAVFSIMHMYCFSHKEWLPGGVGMATANRDDEDAPVNLRVDTSMQAVFTRAADVLSVRDVLEDAARNFRSRYASYIMQGIEGGIVTEGRADHVMLAQGASRAAAAAHGVREVVQPPRADTITVHESQLGTDKEALFASAPDTVVRVRSDGGTETVVQHSGVDLGTVAPSPTAPGVAFAGGAEEADGPSRYGLIMAVDGVTDATKLAVEEPEVDTSSMRVLPHSVSARRKDSDASGLNDAISRTDSRHSFSLPAPAGVGGSARGEGKWGSASIARSRAPTTDSLDDISAVANATSTANKAAMIAASAAAAAAAVAAAVAAREAALAAGAGAAPAGVSKAISSRLAGGARAAAPLGALRAAKADAPVFAHTGVADDIAPRMETGHAGMDDTNGETFSRSGVVGITAEEVLASIQASGHADGSPDKNSGIAAAISHVTLSERQQRAMARQKGLTLSASRVTPATSRPTDSHAASLATPDTWTFAPDLAAAEDDDDLDDAHSMEPEPAPKSALALGLSAAAAKLAGKTASGSGAAVVASGDGWASEIVAPPAAAAAAAPSGDVFAFDDGRAQRVSHVRRTSAGWLDVTKADELAPAVLQEDGVGVPLAEAAAPAVVWDESAPALPTSWSTTSAAASTATTSGEVHFNADEWGVPAGEAHVRVAADADEAVASPPLVVEVAAPSDAAEVHDSSMHTPLRTTGEDEHASWDFVTSPRRAEIHASGVAFSHTPASIATDGGASRHGDAFGAWDDNTPDATGSQQPFEVATPAGFAADEIGAAHVQLDEAAFDDAAAAVDALDASSHAAVDVHEPVPQGATVHEEADPFQMV